MRATNTKLTPTELEVLTLIAKGNTSKEAAKVSRVSKRTIDFHLANIFEKFQVNNRVQAIRCAIRLGILPADVMSI